MNGPRRKLLAASFATIVALSLSSRAGAQGTPGNAPGSQTGDTGSAYTGLASAPEANLFTGIAQTSIPIQVPPGRLGLAPVLALSYTSAAGAGPYGYGWTLPLARIHRSTRHGVPHYDDSDEFVLEMPGALVELEPVPGLAAAYRAKIESAFLRIGFERSGNYWKVIDKLGVTFLFGMQPMTRSGRGSARDQTFAWLLERVEDPAGNRIDFTYRAGGNGGTSTALPDVIRYGANARTGLPHFAEVRFEWTAVAHAGRVSWREGYEDRLDVRLSAITTRTHGLAARRYDFSFEEDPTTADLRLAGVTLTGFAESPADDVQLPSTVFVYAPTMHEGWPALGSRSEGAEPYEIPMAGHLRLGRGDVTADSLDLNGDAKIDRVDISLRPPNVWLGDGHSFTPAGSWNWPTGPSAPRVLRKSDGSGNLVSNVFDLDGDSLADLVDSNPAACASVAGYWCVWRGTTTGFASTPVTWRAPVGKLRQTANGGSRIVIDLVDIDSDGRLELLDATVHDAYGGHPYWNVYRNTGSGFATQPTPLAAPFPFLSRSTSGRTTHGLLDLNADSLPDVVVADPLNFDDTRWGRYPYWEVYFNTGDRIATTPVQWAIDGGVGDGTGLPNFLSLHAKDGTTIADLFDLTGDGRPDFVRRTRGLEPQFSGVPKLCRAEPRCASPDTDESAVSGGHCCFNLLVFVNTGSSFSQPVGWSSPAHGLRSDFETCPYEMVTPCSVAYVYDFDFFDIDGDGLVEFVERHTSGGKPYSWMVHPHPASAAGGNARPNLLIAMRNGVGGETMLRYGNAAATPDTRLPFPHWLVIEREMHDSLYDQAPLRTSFAYRGGAFDRSDREMRGFAVVQEVDTAGGIRVREYHQDRRRSGRMLRVTNLPSPSCTASDPENPEDPCSPWQAPLGVTEYDWPEGGPVLLTRESDVPFHDGESVENLRRTTSYSYDAFGNVARREIRTPLAATTTTTTEFVHRVSDGPGGLPATYLVSKPAHAKTEEAGRTSPLVEREFTYNWSAPPLATLARASTCVTWSDADCERWSRRSFEYDLNGNMIVAHAPDDATSRTTYDANALFAVESTDPVGQKTSSATEPRTGFVTETVAPNGNRMRSKYDGLGRLLRSWGPGTTKLAPLRRFEYAPGELGDSPTRVVAHDAATGDEATFFDGLGRVVATKKASANGDSPVSLVSGLRLYNARGLVAAETLPFESDDLRVDKLTERFEDAPAWLEFDYDEAARLIETRAPDGSATHVDRSAPGILRTEDANFGGGTHPGKITLEVFDGLGRRLLRDSCSARPTAASPYDCPAGTLLRREGWQYDGLGRAIEERTEGLGIAAGDSVTRIERDGLGNRSSMFQSNAGTWRFSSDDSGRTVEVTKPDGSRLTTSYDDAGRIRRRRGPTSRATYSYHKDGGGIGKLLKMTTRTRAMRVTEKSDYDDRGRIVTRDRSVSVRGGRAAKAVASYRYDDLDRRIATRIDGWDPAGEEVVTSYDALGHESSVLTVAGALVNDSSYDPEGRLTRIDYGNGLSSLVDYERRDNALAATGHLRCTRTTFTGASSGGACAAGPSDLAAMQYTDFDENGNLLALADALHASGDALNTSRTYGYDALGRLREAGRDLSALEPYDFDPLGNVRRNASTVLEYDDTEHPSRLTSIRDASGSTTEVKYDANGRRRVEGDRIFEYDDQDRLVEIREGDIVVASYGYTDSGERVFSRTSNGLELELGDGLRIRGNSTERTIAFAGRPIAVLRGRVGAPPEVVFLHLDHQQSVTLTTDAVGRPVEHFRYAPFGARIGTFDNTGNEVDLASSRYAFTGHPEERDSNLLFAGSRFYDPVTASFLTLDPSMQFASPYAYSDGNPILGRDPDGKVYELSAIEILTLLAGTATFIDSIVRTGDLGHSLTAGVFAGFSIYVSNQLSTALARPFAGTGYPYLQMVASVASDGFQALGAVESIEDGRYAGGVLSAALLASSLIGIESANDPGPGTTPGETQERHGIKDRGMIDGRRVIDVDGICATRPGCVTNTLIAAQENLRVLFGGTAACVGGCDHVAKLAGGYLDANENVLLRCNSFGTIKCLGALQRQGLEPMLSKTDSAGNPRLVVEMSGAPLLRPPVFKNVTYQVNLFDPVIWMGAGYSTPFSSDVVLGKNWWVPVPLIVHHSRMYEKPFAEALGEMIP